ncbi:hypothetical protein ACA910_017846 [Epithemia clementina (nom. ined.)]
MSRSSSSSSSSSSRSSGGKKKAALLEKQEEFKAQQQQEQPQQQQPALRGSNLIVQSSSSTEGRTYNSRTSSASVPLRPRPIRSSSLSAAATPPRVYRSSSSSHDGTTSSTPETPSLSSSSSSLSSFSLGSSGTTPTTAEEGTWSSSSSTGAVDPDATSTTDTAPQQPSPLESVDPLFATAQDATNSGALRTTPLPMVPLLSNDGAATSDATPSSGIYGANDPRTQSDSYQSSSSNNKDDGNNDGKDATGLENNLDDDAAVDDVVFHDTLEEMGFVLADSSNANVKIGNLELGTSATDDYAIRADEERAPHTLLLISLIAIVLMVLRAQRWHYVQLQQSKQQ